MDRLRNQCYHDSTKQNYYRIWKAFSAFYFRLDVKPESWEERIVLFIAHLVEENKQSSTIRSYISGLRAILKQDRVKLEEDQFLITSLTKAARLRNNCVRLRLPIQKPMLGSLIHRVRNYYEDQLNQPYLSLLYQTILTVGYYGMFRIGELTSGDHAVKADDVHMGTNKDKFMFVLWTSKTHWKDSKLQTVKLSSQYEDRGKCHAEDLPKEEEEYPLPCPYELLRIYSKVRGPYHKGGNEPFFVFADGSPVRPVHVRKCLKKALTLAGFQSNVYSFHSLRAGRSQDLLKYRLSVETIKKLGGGSPTQSSAI